MQLRADNGEFRHHWIGFREEGKKEEDEKNSFFFC